LVDLDDVPAALLGTWGRQCASASCQNSAPWKSIAACRRATAARTSPGAVASPAASKARTPAWTRCRRRSKLREGGDGRLRVRASGGRGGTAPAPALMRDGKRARLSLREGGGP
jgi:hypothetical protein